MLRVDFDTLSSSAALCGGQADHVARIKSYVSHVCDRPEAFRGVLNLFQGSYCSGINAALAGLENSVHIGNKMSAQLRATREDFLEADHAAYKRMRSALEVLGAIVPYEVPGGNGDYARGGTPPPSDPGKKDDDLHPLDAMSYADAARDGGFRDTQHETDQPDWAKSHKQLYNDWRDDRTHKDADEREVDANADKRVEDRQHAARVEAGQKAKADALANGATRHEASEAGSQARRDADDNHRNVNEATDLGGRTGAHANDLYNEATGLKQNWDDLFEHLDNVSENQQQAEDLDTFRDRDEDQALQDWGSR